MCSRVSCAARVRTMGNKERCKRYYYSHREKMLELHKLYYQAHKEDLKKKAREYRKTHRHLVNAWRKNRIVKLKQEIFELLGNKCANCGFNDVDCLQIDHVNGGGNQERKRFRRHQEQYLTHVLKQIQNGSKDYQLLCANCNIKKEKEKKRRLP